MNDFINGLLAGILGTIALLVLSSYYSYKKKI